MVSIRSSEPERLPIAVRRLLESNVSMLIVICRLYFIVLGATFFMMGVVVLFVKAVRQLGAQYTRVPTRLCAYFWIVNSVSRLTSEYSRCMDTYPGCEC